MMSYLTQIGSNPFTILLMHSEEFGDDIICNYRFHYKLHLYIFLRNSWTLGEATSLDAMALV